MKPQKSFTYRDNIGLDRDVKTLFDWVSNLEVVTTNPDGARYAGKGEAVLLITGGNYYLEVNVDGANIWRGIQLQNLP